jgi:hypothetical protein
VSGFIIYAAAAGIIKLEVKKINKLFLVRSA